MSFFLEDHQFILKTLRAARVDFLIVGGYAVIYHGFPRATGDIDIWIGPGDVNKQKLLEALDSAGFEQDSLNQIGEMNFSEYLVFSAGSPPSKVDFMTKISGVSFQEAYQEKEIVVVDGMEVPFIHINHLILSKISNDRIKDKADVEELQRVLKYKKGK
jgi:predicted nucleotidyltransferase